MRLRAVALVSFWGRTDGDAPSLSTQSKTRTSRLPRTRLSLLRLLGKRDGMDQRDPPVAVLAAEQD